jgi:hypothetical protein
MRLTGVVETAAGAATSEPDAAPADPAAVEIPWLWRDGGSSWAAAVCVDFAAAATLPAGLPAMTAADLSSCATARTGAAAVADAPLVALATGGFTITGPEGGREAMAGAGGAETIGGAWRGNGTTLRGAGADPRFAVATSAAVDAETDTAGEAARGAADVAEAEVFPAEAAATGGLPVGCCVGGAEIAARGGTARPSRCSFCC